jgi:SAM-dependent methyltransferase
MYKREQQHQSDWAALRVDWKKSYLDTWKHPHRQMIVDALRGFEFESVLEAGCSSGPNLLRIHREFPHAKLSGTDVNAQAIGVAREHLEGDFRVGTLAEARFPDQCADVVLTDMMLIYVSKIDETFEEMRRVARRHVVLCEFHSGRAWERAGLNLMAGYRAHDYPALLRRHGWRNITMAKIPTELWPQGRTQRRFGYVMTGSV